MPKAQSEIAKHSDIASSHCAAMSPSLSEGEVASVAGRLGQTKPVLSEVEGALVAASFLQIFRAGCPEKSFAKIAALSSATFFFILLSLIQEILIKIKISRLLMKCAIFK